MLESLLKKLYKGIPFKKQLFTFVKIFYSPPHHIYKHLHFTGWLTVPVKDDKTFKIYHYGYELENEIFWKGLTSGWEAQSLKLWIALSAISKVTMDIGANTGIYGLVSKTINPASIVYAFEPVHRVYIRLVNNIRENRFDIRAMELAISNKDGDAVIFDQPTEHIYSVTVNKNLASKNVAVNSVNIKTKTLKALVEEHGLSGIDLLKIDVETHEPEVLEGFGEYLESFAPFILVEILSNEIGQKIQTIVGSKYTFYRIYESIGLKKVSQVVMNGRDGYNYFAVPASRDQVFRGMGFKIE